MCQVNKCRVRTIMGRVLGNCTKPMLGISTVLKVHVLGYEKIQCVLGFWRVESVLKFLKTSNKWPRKLSILVMVPWVVWNNWNWWFFDFYFFQIPITDGSLIRKKLKPGQTSTLLRAGNVGPTQGWARDPNSQNSPLPGPNLEYK